MAALRISAGFVVMQPWSLSEEEQKGLGDFLMGNWEKRNFLALILLKITTRSKRSLLWERSFTALWRDVSGRRKWASPTVPGKERDVGTGSVRMTKPEKITYSSTTGKCYFANCRRLGLLFRLTLKPWRWHKRMHPNSKLYQCKKKTDKAYTNLLLWIFSLSMP